ncbi:uncharacterized protein PAC_10140 [Phialocephala subalpina]|uniref:Uncharacterized protein n=1 Tax=Phialocephala subalpina TaxID=576137 RepID=A0A1L7X5F3_9HELO|nr:uncharacterized protein PAC_10140 [Phialocephala subalpina]
MFFKTLVFAAVVGTAIAQRPSNTSICDYYTTALLKNNTAANQKTLLTLVVNTAVIDTQPNVGVSVPGILAPGQVNSVAVNLLPYFNGELASTNTGGSVGHSVNFLDGGGAAPLMKNLPANNPGSAQYTLLTHLYEYFGVLLGCSMQGGADYPAYSGHGSQYNVHKFMDLSYAEVTWFIDQVALSAMSFGVAKDDLAVVGTALNSFFNYRCALPMVVVSAQGPQLQSICIDSTCPISPNGTCSSYQAAMKPALANTTLSTTNSTVGPYANGSCIAGSSCSSCTYINGVSSCTGGSCNAGSSSSSGGSSSGTSSNGGAGSPPGSGSSSSSSSSAGGSSQGPASSGSGSSSDNSGSSTGSNTPCHGGNSGSSAGSSSAGSTASTNGANNGANGAAGGASGAGSSSSGGSAGGAGSGSSSSYTPATVATAGADTVGMSFAAIAGGFAALLL